MLCTHFHFLWSLLFPGYFVLIIQSVRPWEFFLFFFCYDFFFINQSRGLWARKRAVRAPSSWHGVPCKGWSSSEERWETGNPWFCAKLAKGKSAKFAVAIGVVRQWSVITGYGVEKCMVSSNGVRMKKRLQ